MMSQTPYGIFIYKDQDHYMALQLSALFCKNQSMPLDSCP